jgi:hypothetical protein
VLFGVRVRIEASFDRQDVRHDAAEPLAVAA